jgi:hypothetical protein
VPWFGLASFGANLSIRPFSLALRFRPQWSPLGPSRGLRSPAEVRSRLAPFASAQPSCRLPAPALDVGLAPFVSCHSFRPAFWPASLRLIGSRLCAFVLKRPSGMPLALRRRLLAPAVSSGPRAGFQSLRPFLQPSGNRPLACASADCSGLTAFTSCGCQLPTACGPPGSQSSPGLRPSESALSPAPACVRLAPRAALEPAFRSCLGVPVIVEAPLAPHFNLPGLPFPDGALAGFHPSGAFRTVLETSACASAPRPILPDLPSGPNLLCLACALHPQSVRPACLCIRLQACALRFLLRLRRGLDRLIELSACACCSCLPGPFESNRRSTAWSSIAENIRRGQSVYASANRDFSVDNFSTL